ncbi:APC family permease [Cellulomonas sp. P24]|uniref:APC family permease n=1 Tax=Cellulomonas sp. P24 TaxID=2885206 RepID=UPI00216B1037|nr:APC family permease [Cellulomonas sp. P24]MCR6491543.1 APC family permease [Cellulomonas sp. P24]
MAEATTDGTRRVGLWGVVSIGIGGMVGGGIFAVLGLSVQIAGGGAPVAFLVAGLVALLTARSYALLSASFPSRGGTVTFVNRAFGPGLFAGGINVLLWLSYIVMLALYSQAFGSYAASFLPAEQHELGKHMFLTVAVVLIAVLNVAGASTVARAERYVVAVKLTILLLFVVVGMAGVSTSRLAPDQWSPPLSLVAGGMIVFLAYEGFELIANAAEDVVDPARTLKRAYYISVVFVIVLYVLVAVVAVGSVPVAQLVDARDYALAVAARPTLGQAGFALIGVAAMLSTASAINATLYGSARMTYTIAKARELPAQLERPIWNQPLEGLIITAAATLVLANVLNLQSISTMGSAGFLIIFAVVNIAEARTSKQRGSAPWISIVGAVACVGALAALLAKSSLGSAGVLVAMVGVSFGIEAVFRRMTGRGLRA